jgi:hypothetical protein
MAISRAIMAITTSNSTSVKACPLRLMKGENILHLKDVNQCSLILATTIIVPRFAAMDKKKTEFTAAAEPI